MTPNEIPEIELFSDGGAEPNPGKGGFGVILSYQGRSKEFSQGFKLTTNNRMELMGVIFGLEQLKKRAIVKVYTDSQYVINGIEKGWAVKWRSKNWFRNKNEKAVNADLWERLLDLISIQQEVSFYWIKGHAGHVENERCDELALAALNGEELYDDLGYSPKEFVEEFTSGSTELLMTRGPKVEFEGDPCRKCNTKIVKRSTKRKQAKVGQTYYYEYYLFCPSCKTMYFVDDAKRDLTANSNDLFS